jgi:hypothetical protein
MCSLCAPVYKYTLNLQWNHPISFGRLVGDGRAVAQWNSQEIDTFPLEEIKQVSWWLLEEGWNKWGVLTRTSFLVPGQTQQSGPRWLDGGAVITRRIAVHTLVFRQMSQKVAIVKWNLLFRFVSLAPQRYEYSAPVLAREEGGMSL